MIGVTSFGHSERCGIDHPGFARITPKVKSWIMSNALGSEDSSLFRVSFNLKEAYFKSEAPDGYTARLGDCPGNDLWHLHKGSSSLEDCANQCNKDYRCRAFMLYDYKVCYPKSFTCESTSLDDPKNVFYSKITPLQFII